MLSLSIARAQKAFAVDGDLSVFDTTVISRKDFIKALATAKKLYKKQHNNKQRSIETCLDWLYSVIHLSMQISAAKVQNWPSFLSG